MNNLIIFLPIALLALAFFAGFMIGKLKAETIYYLHYVKDCSPQVMSFNDVNKLQSFMSEFAEKYGNDYSSDFWLDAVYFRGKKLTIKQNFTVE